MSACLWNDIDTALVNAITADMVLAPPAVITPPELYLVDPDNLPTPSPPQILDGVDLAIRTVLVGETVNPDQHTLPLVLIRGMDAQYGEDGPHGDGEIHIDTIVYPYDLVAIARIEPGADESVAVTTRKAKAAATELLRRLREVVRSRPALGITAAATDGERLDYVRFGQGAMVSVTGYGGVNGGYLVQAMLPIEVIGSI